jgi:hypothetical protein
MHSKALTELPRRSASCSTVVREIWDDLWSRLRHQGTVYTASYAALPRLAQLAMGRDPAGFVEPLFLASCIIASTDGQVTKAVDVRTQYAGTISVLREVAEQLVPVAGDDTDFVYRVQALIAERELKKLRKALT